MEYKTMEENAVYDISPFDGGGGAGEINHDDLDKILEARSEAHERAALREVVKMAVMKTCCGCLSTRSGTMTILMLSAISYIAGIVFAALDMGEDGLEKRIREAMTGDDDCKTGENADTWWCDALYDFRDNTDLWLTLAIVKYSLFLILALLAIFGTSKCKHWFILPWIVCDFIVLAALTVFCVVVVIVMGVYKPEGEDSSDCIAYGVILAVIMAFLFYLWLCVVSHFQVLREVDKLGLMHRLDDVRSIHGVGGVYDGEDATSRTDADEEKEDEDEEDEEDEDDEEEKEDSEADDDMEYQPKVDDDDKKSMASAMEDVEQHT